MHLRVEDLGCHVSGDFSLKHLDLELPAGARLGLIGPNGAGKSTLLRALTGLLPCSGRILLDGKSLATYSARARARAICLMPQSEEGGSAFTVVDYVRLGRYPHLSLFGNLSAQDESRVDHALAMAGCADWRDRTLGELSGGERQLVRLAAALAQESRILLLDEPGAFLDPGQRRRLWVRLDQVLAEDDLSLIFVSHDVNEVLRRADRFLALKAGNRVRSGPVADLCAGDWLGELFGLPLKACTIQGHDRPWLLEAPDAGNA